MNVKLNVNQSTPHSTVSQNPDVQGKYSWKKPLLYSAVAAAGVGAAALAAYQLGFFSSDTCPFVPSRPLLTCDPEGPSIEGIADDISIDPYLVLQNLKNSGDICIETRDL